MAWKLEPSTERISEDVLRIPSVVKMVYEHNGVAIHGVG